MIFRMRILLGSPPVAAGQIATAAATLRYRQ
jgi:hypothetical protein